jgi:hypothetical protein
MAASSCRRGSDVDAVAVEVHHGRKRWPSGVHHGPASPLRGATATSRRQHRPGNLAKYLPSLLDTADELKAVAKKLDAAAGDLHLGSEVSETVVKRTTLADCRVVYFVTHGLVAGDVAGLGEPSLALTLPREPSELDDGS